MIYNKIKPGMLKLTTSRGQRSLHTVFIFVISEEKSCYRIVSLGQQNFDCRSYCGLSHRKQGFPNWLSRARAPANCLGPPHTSRQKPDKTFWNLALSDFARQAPILSQTCLNSPHTSRQVEIFCRPTKNRLVCGDLYSSSTVYSYHHWWWGSPFPGHKPQHLRGKNNHLCTLQANWYPQLSPSLLIASPTLQEVRSQQSAPANQTSCAVWSAISSRGHLRCVPFLRSADTLPPFSNATYNGCHVSVHVMPSKTPTW